MRARTAFLAAALVLCACTEGKAPVSPISQGPGGATDSVSPTDVLGDGPGTTARPPPASDEAEFAVEVVPPAEPATGSATVTGLEEGQRGLSSVSQVDVDLTVRGVPGRGTVQVEFVPPSGLPYERRTQVVEAQPDVPRTLRFSLPVSGTTVATSGMSGSWQVRFFLDGAPLTTAAFTLEP